MAFVSLTFLALLAFGSLGPPQVKAQCGFTADLWGGKASSGGSCARRSLDEVVEDITDNKDSDSEEEVPKEEVPNEEARTEAKGSSFLDFIQKLINFVWMIYKWFSNSNNK